MDITLNVVDRVLASAIADSPEFYEFCNTLDELGELTSTEMYLYEEVIARGHTAKKDVGDIIRNTGSTTKNVGRAYNDLTSAGGTLIKSAWDLMVKLLSLIVKAIKFISNKIAHIPNMLADLIDMIAKIPANVRAKIRGDIKLYISLDDVKMVFNDAIILHLMTFVNLADQLSKGDMWSSFFKRGAHEGKNLKDIIFGKNDMKICSKMASEYRYFQGLKFSQTIIDMSNPDTVDAYFGKGTIQINYGGNAYHYTYYQALDQLIKQINDGKDILIGLQQDVEAKVSRTQDNDQFASISAGKRQTIMNTIQMMAKTTEILGSMVRYVISDMTTIQKTTKQILARQEEINNKTAKKKIIGRKDKGIEGVDINTDPKEAADYADKMKEQGYVKVDKYIKDPSGNVTKTVQGQDDPYNSGVVWVQKDKVPRGAKVYK